VPFKAIVEWRKDHNRPYGFDNDCKVKLKPEMKVEAKDEDGVWKPGVVVQSAGVEIEGGRPQTGEAGGGAEGGSRRGPRVVVECWDISFYDGTEASKVRRDAIRPAIKDRRLAQFRIYEPVPLCLFCTQFFDGDFSDYVEYHLGSTDIKDPALEVEDVSGTRNELNPDVTKKLQDYSVHHIIKTDYIRPTSAFLQEMEMDALRDKK
jgi:hypothetical protein